MKNTNIIKVIMLAGILSIGGVSPSTSYNSLYASEDDDHKDEHGEENVVKLSKAELKEKGIIVSLVKKHVLQDTFNAPGEVKSNLYASSQITSRIPAQIVERFVKMGDVVSANQALISLSSVEMAEAQGDLILKHLEWKRAQMLGKDVISEQKFLEAKVQAQQAKAKVIAFGMTKQQVEGLLKNSDASLASGAFILFAQQSGTVTQDNFVLGQYIDAGKPLMKIINEDSVWIEAQLSPNKAAAIKVGAEAWTVKNNFSLQGKVVQVGHIVNEESRTIAVRAEFDNKSDIFHSGEFVDVKINTGLGSSVLAVPNNSITLLEGKKVIFKLEGDEIHPTEINVGKTSGNLTEILSGIQAGDPIVTSQVFFVKSLILKSKMGEGHGH